MNHRPIVQCPCATATIGPTWCSTARTFTDLAPMQARSALQWGSIRRCPPVRCQMHHYVSRGTVPLCVLSSSRSAGLFNVSLEAQVGPAGTVVSRQAPPNEADESRIEWALVNSFASPPSLLWRWRGCPQQSPHWSCKVLGRPTDYHRWDQSRHNRCTQRGVVVSKGCFVGPRNECRSSSSPALNDTCTAHTRRSRVQRCAAGRYVPFLTSPSDLQSRSWSPSPMQSALYCRSPIKSR